MPLRSRPRRNQMNGGGDLWAGGAGLRLLKMGSAAAVVVLVGGCTSKVPATEPVSTVRDPALEKACAAALPVRDLIEKINKEGVITPEATAQVKDTVTPFSEAAMKSGNVELRAVGEAAGKHATTFADPSSSEAQRDAAYHPLIRAVAQAFPICRSVKVSMPGDPPNTAGMGSMDGMRGM